MRLTKAWTVALKDFRIFARKRNILYTFIYFEAFISIGMPFVIRLIASRLNSSAVLPIFLNAFSFWYVIGAALLPVSIASYSLIGEKVQKSLEPLLATPTTDGEILVGKSLAAFIPAFCANLLGAVVFCTLTNIFTSGVLGHAFYPNWNIVIILFLLSPLSCLLSIGYNIIISSRSTDVRAAQQLGTLILLPFAAIYVLAEIQILTLNTETFLILAAVLVFIDIAVFYAVNATFQREEILTKWK